MNDTISRAAALEVISAVKDITWSQSGKVLCGKMYSQIKDLSAVDAVPVVHGRWKQTDAYPHWLYCLNCYKRIVPNVEWIEAYNIPTNYCPNCGAKMDGEANG